MDDPLTEPDDLLHAREVFARFVRTLAALRELLHDHGFTDEQAEPYLRMWWASFLDGGDD